MLLSNDKPGIEKARFWATQSREPRPWYEHKEIGYNYRMSNVVAGIGRGQLLHLRQHVLRKKAIYERYKAAFSGLPLRMNPYLADSEPNFWLSCVLIDEGCPVSPARIMETFSEKNIESRPIWKPMHLQPVFSDRDFISSEGDAGADIFRRGLCLPSDVKMTEEEQDKVIAIFKKCFA